MGYPVNLLQQTEIPKTIQSKGSEICSIICPKCTRKKELLCFLLLLSDMLTWLPTRFNQLALSNNKNNSCNLCCKKLKAAGNLGM